MGRFLRTIKRKCKAASGMTLGEVLVATLILLLSASVLTATASLAYRQYSKSIREGESQVLCSTLRNLISSELAYTTDIQIDTSTGELQYFSSRKSYTESTFTSLDRDAGGYGYIALQNYEDGDACESILGKGAYARGLLAKVDSVTYDADHYCFTVELSIGYKGAEYYAQQFQVLNVNQTKANA